MGMSVFILRCLFLPFGFCATGVSAIRFRGFRLTRDNFSMVVAFDGESVSSFIVLNVILYLKGGKRRLLFSCDGHANHRFVIIILAIKKSLRD